MLSSFFSKSKPINYIVVALYMLTLFVIAHYKRGFVAESGYIIKFVAGALLYVLPMLMLHFIVQRNDLTHKGTHTILLYAFLTAIVPYALTNTTILLANVFVLLALRNVLYLRNEKQMKSKIFNATIYIGLSSLVYFWSIGFIILVFIGILYFEPKNYRNWIIPVIGLGMVYLFANCFTLLFYDSFYTFTEYVAPVSVSYQGYLIKDQLFSVGILGLCMLFFSSIYLIKLNRKAANIKPVLRLVFAYLIVAVGVAAIAPQKNTSELFFVAIPLAIIGTPYLEMSSYQFAKEINIWVFILIPLTTLLF